MELKLNKEEICSSEVILSTKQEQAIELDYVLPDYCPEIFKIVKCITTPRIASYNVNGDKLSYEISVSMRILYCTESSNAIQVIEQKMMYSKTADMGRTGINPNVKICPKVDYINCRAINQRRLDIRGALSIEICVTDTVKNELVSDAYGMNMQLKKIPVTYPVNRLFTTKQISISEEFELGMSKPSIENIVWCDTVVASTDKKVIANKMVAKGELLVNLLYTFSENEKNGVESMQFTVPFSQIIELEGIDERFECSVDADIMSCDIMPRSDGEGNSKIADCNLSLMIKCSAYRIATVELATDQYSTQYESEAAKTSVKMEMAPQTINSVNVIKASIESCDENIECVFNARSGIKEYTTEFNDETKQLIITGTASYTVIACGDEEKPIVIDKDEPFEICIQLDENSCNCEANIKIMPISCSYNLVSDNTVEIKTEIKVCGTVTCSKMVDGISDIFVDEAAEIEHKNDCALKMYFANVGENIWDIAKRYCTSVSAIIDENDIDGDTICQDCMILIPII